MFAITVPCCTAKTCRCVQWLDRSRSHWSQFSPEELKTMIDEDARDTTNTIYFRKFAVASGRDTDFD